ncbi:hypothetical protein QBC45DRAFT_444388 [Copromyces sp. CBS 386.78]|nr:hypothetical protein QBC45DRAFT_444388 [Copromyces sp. CBS 386.78]
MPVPTPSVVDMEPPQASDTIMVMDGSDSSDDGDAYLSDASDDEPCTHPPQHDESPGARAHECRIYCRLESGHRLKRRMFPPPGDTLRPHRHRRLLHCVPKVDNSRSQNQNHNAKKVLSFNRPLTPVRTEAEKTWARTSWSPWTPTEPAPGEASFEVSLVGLSSQFPSMSPTVQHVVQTGGHHHADMEMGGTGSGEVEPSCERSEGGVGVEQEGGGGGGGGGASERGDEEGEGELEEGMKQMRLDSHYSI